MLMKMRQRREIVVLAMLHHKHCAGLHKLRCKYFAGNLAEIGQIVGRIHKYYIKLLSRRLDKTEHIALDERHILHIELVAHLAYEIILHMALFDRCHRLTFARQELKTHRTGACKEVERHCALKVDEVFNNIKYVFARKVGGRSRTYVARHIEASTAIFSSYYSHNASSIKW